MDPNPDNLGWSATLDQMMAGMADMAKLLGSYRRELLEAGFSRLEALQLCAGYQQTLLTGSSDDDQEPPQ